MSTFLIQIVLLAGGAVYFGWTAAGALRSGEISVYVRANREPIRPAAGQSFS